MGHVVAELVEIGIVEEKLREHKVRAGIHLLLQVGPVGVLAFLASNMPLGKASHANAEIALLTNEAHQLAGELETARSDLEFATARRVRSEEHTSELQS